MNTSEQINELAAALAKAQGEIANPGKDSTNPHFKSHYADLAAVINAVRKPFSANGIGFVQCPVGVDGGVCVTTRLLHASGQWMEFDSPVLTVGGENAAQETGALITYLRRYTLAGVAGIFQEDDDGNSLSESAPVQTVVDNTEYMDFFYGNSPQAFFCYCQSVQNDKDLGEDYLKALHNSHPFAPKTKEEREEGKEKGIIYMSDAKAHVRSLEAVGRDEIRSTTALLLDFASAGDHQGAREITSELNRYEKQYIAAHGGAELVAFLREVKKQEDVVNA